MGSETGTSVGKWGSEEKEGVASGTSTVMEGNLTWMEDGTPVGSEVGRGRESTDPMVGRLMLGTLGREKVVSFDPGKVGVVPLNPEKEGVVPLNPEKEGVVPLNPGKEGVVPLNPEKERLVPLNPEKGGVVPLKPGGEMGKVVTLEPFMKLERMSEKGPEI